MHVLATAGHVDHGKSTLIERLTGIDPDRLAEEKARGMTIDLGFAWLTLPSGREVGIVDVPGHERFVHTMLAGAGPVDAALFVVAANEGWKPQSEEHLAILDLLGARHAVVALTKSDLVDPADLESASDAVRAHLSGTTLHDSPIVSVSATTGDGIPELLAEIDTMLDEAGDPDDAGRARVWVDRSFSIKGAGTVVTGTLTGGTLRVDDTVEVLPKGSRARIRGIQTHKAARAKASPVSRVALNLGGLDRHQIARGDAIVAPGRWRTTTTLDVRLRAVRALDHPLEARGAFKAHIGTAEVDARLAWFGIKALHAGEEGLARLTLAEPVAAGPLDRVVLRDTGRRATVAGGVVLDAHPPAARAEARAAQLAARAAAAPHELPRLAVEERGVVARADLAWLAATEEPPPGARALGDFVVSQARFDELTTAIANALAEFHAREPLAAGMPREDARAAAGIEDPRLFAGLLDALAGNITQTGPLLRAASHQVRLDPVQEKARAELLREMDAAGFAPPARAALEQTYGAKLVRALTDAGDLIKISSEIVFTATTLARARDAIKTAIEREGPLTASRVRELLGTSRKYAIPLLEYLDATGFTRRRDDLRDLAR
ncbi:MAG: selenocysteine-specific translation elongation factor [Actinomycetota bacterium]